MTQRKCTLSWEIYFIFIPCSLQHELPLFFCGTNIGKPARIQKLHLVSQRERERERFSFSTYSICSIQIIHHKIHASCLQFLLALIYVSKSKNPRIHLIYNIQISPNSSNFNKFLNFLFTYIVWLKFRFTAEN